MEISAAIPAGRSLVPVPGRYPKNFPLAEGLLLAVSLGEQWDMSADAEQAVRV
jgi:hypothetical protein